MSEKRELKYIKQGENMLNVYIKTEAGIFCLLVIIFLYFFRRRNLPGSEYKLMYIFAGASVLFSVIGNIVGNKILFALCGVSSFLTLCFCLSCFFISKEIKVTNLSKVLCTILSAFFGIATFYLTKYKVNVTTYLLVFISIALFMMEQNKKIKVDRLTKLYNRYGMDAELKEQLRQYKKEKTDSFYIISCDLDNFKHINDTWGHSEGDRALVLVAEALSRVGKKIDAEVFRIGGDEFVIITDKSCEGLAEKVVRFIKDELDNIEFRTDFDIKMSIGVALYDGKTTIDDLLNHADKKMYEAKKDQVLHLT